MDTIIVVDTRETLPFRFDDIYGDKQEGGKLLNVPTVHRSLIVGDYTLKGFEDKIVVERKTLSDLVGSLTSNRGIFERRIEKMHLAFKVSYVVCEEGWDALQKKYGRLAKPVFRSILSWSIKYPTVHWFLMPSRREAEVFTFRVLQMFAKKYRG